MTRKRQERLEERETELLDNILFAEKLIQNQEKSKEELQPQIAEMEQELDKINFLKEKFRKR